MLELKNCSKCGKNLPLNMFHSIRNQCKDCIRIRKNEWQRLSRHNLLPKITPRSELKIIVCSRCGKEKHINEFYNIGRVCRVCQSEQATLRHKKELEIGIKLCNSCCEIKRISDFDRGRNQCKPCRLKYRNIIEKDLREGRRARITNREKFNIKEIECTMCGVIKAVSNFSAGKGECKECLRLKSKKYRNDEFIKERIRIYNKEHKHINRDKINKYQRDRRSSDPAYKFLQNIRSRFILELKNRIIPKNKSTLKFLKIDKSKLMWLFETFLKELNSVSKRQYVLDDFLNGELVIDHIRPICSFNIKSENEINIILQCFGIDNLQFLPVECNRKKGYKWDGTDKNLKYKYYGLDKKDGG